MSRPASPIVWATSSRPRNFLGRRALSRPCDWCSSSISARTGCAGRPRISEAASLSELSIPSRHSLSGSTLLLDDESSFPTAYALAPRTWPTSSTCIVYFPFLASGVREQREHPDPATIMYNVYG